MSLINTKVQPFKTQAFHDGKFEEVTEKNFADGKKWSVVIFIRPIRPQREEGGRCQRIERIVR